MHKPSKEETKKNQEINEYLRQEKKKFESTIKLLLLGEIENLSKKV